MFRQPRPVLSGSPASKTSFPLRRGISKILTIFQSPLNGYDTEEAYIQANLVFTLYDGGLRRAQVRQAVARQRQAKQALSIKNESLFK